jgi:hypothetical protein
MTWRVPPFDRAFVALEAYVRETYAPLGIVVCGSIVRGNPGPRSDFDVCVVHDQPWRLREQRRFEGVPAEIFVNTAAQYRRYFASQHAEAKPSTAHMLATGEVLEPASPAVHELVAEARAFMARPITVTPEQLTNQRYGAVDSLDDVRDLLATDPAAAALILARVAQEIIAYAFASRSQFQPRRKDMVSALAGIDPEAAALVRRWATSTGPEAFAAVEELAGHVLGVDTFFEWASARDPTEP